MIWDIYGLYMGYIWDKYGISKNEGRTKDKDRALESI